MNYEFLRNANVEVIADTDTKDREIASIVVNDKYEHRFDHGSRVSKSLKLMTPEDLGERLSGGAYFIVNDSLYDFRDGYYKGFAHDDETIAQLNGLLGIHGFDRLGSDIRVHENVTSGNYKLGREWSSNPVTIKAFKDGANFETALHYGWSPFIKTINSAFMITRLICTNGMRGLRNFMNNKIPLVNRWEEHLNIANIQIQNKVDAIVQRRFAEMAHERASVAELMTLANHVQERIRGNQNPDFLLQDEQLRNIHLIVNPRRHLSEVYQSHIFNKSPAAAQYPGHLTTLDAYNIATEIRSHSVESEKSTTRALDLIANDLVFEHKNIILPSSGKVTRKACAFSDPDAAFFGQMS